MIFYFEIFLFNMQDGFIIVSFTVQISKNPSEETSGDDPLFPIEEFFETTEPLDTLISLRPQ